MSESTGPIVKVSVCREFPPYAGHWWEVSVALDEDDDAHVIETDGMFETVAEAQACGDAWVASDAGRKTIAAVVAAKRRVRRSDLDRIIHRVPEPDAVQEDIPW